MCWRRLKTAVVVDSSFRLKICSLFSRSSNRFVHSNCSFVCLHDDGHDVTTHRYHDTTIPRYHDTTIPRYHDTTIPRDDDTTRRRYNDATTATRTTTMTVSTRKPTRSHLVHRWVTSSSFMRNMCVDQVGWSAS